MRICHLILYSKNKKSLNKAFSIFLNYINTTNPLDKKHFSKKTKKHFVSILKSPHVNKKAQEQFDFKIYSKQLTISCYSQNFKYLYIFKKIKDNLFSDIKCTIKFSIYKNEKKINLDNFRINTIKTNWNFINQNKSLNKIKNLKTFQKPVGKEIKQLLKTIDSYGEIIVL